MSNKKTYNDIDHYLQGEKLAKEVVGIMTEREEEHSVEALTDFMLNNHHAEEFVATMSDAEKFTKKYAETKCDDGANQVAQLVSKLKEGKRRSIAKVRIVRLASSIAAILVVGAFMLYDMELGKSDNEPKLITASGVNSRISRPILIKESGAVVDLLQEGSNVKEVEVVGKEYLSNIVSYAQFEQLESNIPVEIDKIVVPRGYTYQYELCDSTIVYLNAGSELIFPTKFTDETREVTLTGEAFFKVRKDTKPFIVNTNYTKIKVYGTEFNVNTDINGTVETVLLSGSVGVTYKDDKEIKITPNQMISFNVGSGKCDIKDVNTDTYIGWIGGYFLYEDGSFDRIVADLSAWYGVEIYASKLLLTNTKLTFSLSRNIPMERIFEIIEKIANVKFINEGGGRYIIE